MLYPVLLVALWAFGLSVVLTPLCRDLFRRLGFVDQPDHDRKLHTEPVPHMGGVPIVIAFVLSCLCLALLPKSAVPFLPRLSHVLRALPAGFLIFLTGLLDDILHIKPWQKLCGQALAAILAFWAGVHLSSIAGHPFGWAPSLVLTIVWLIACSNAFNLIDGIDGLASGVGLFATITMLVSAFLQQNVVLALATASLTGALLGFLRYNFNPASIFLGDSGSLTIGFLLGCFGVFWSQKAATILGMTAPLLALGIPLIDAGLSVVRRFLRHQPIFGADRDHIHHRLLRRGLTPRRAALILYAVAGTAAALSLALQKADISHMGGVVLVLFCAIAWLGIRQLGYAEFGTAGRMLLAGNFQQSLDARLRVATFEQELQATTSLEECWRCILKTARTFDFVEVRLSVSGSIYQERLRDFDGDLFWTLRVPLPGIGYINFTRPHESAVLVMGVAPFVDAVRKTIAVKYLEFSARERAKAVGAGHFD
jgi:UDP-GlcNAc:undecaprenyl-phosphate GlcNAc-1-phosphate transferase